MISKVRGEKFADVDFIVLSDEHPQTIQQIEREHPGFRFYKLSSSFAALGIHSIPTTYFLNRDLKLVKKSVGLVDWRDPGTQEHFSSLLEQK